jgi:hypothetical protein
MLLGAARYLAETRNFDGTWGAIARCKLPQPQRLILKERSDELLPPRKIV